jgi:O-antigen ligase
MLREERTILWRTSATTLGLALPSVLLGKSVMFGLIALGLISGLAATKDASLRATVRYILESRVFWLCCAIVSAFILSAVLGISPDYSLGKVLEVFSAGLATIAVFIALREMPGRYVALLMKSLVLGVCGMVAISLVDAFADSYRFSAALHGTDKALTPHRLNFVSSALAVLLPFVWAYYVRRRAEQEPLAKMSAPVVLPLTLATVFISGGRAGWLAVTVAALLFILLASNRTRFTLHGRQWLALGGSIGLGLFGYGFSRGFGHLLARMELGAQTGSRGLGGGRWEIWQTSWQHLWDQPMTGIGVNAFRFLPEKLDLHPHNFLLQLALETGIIGFLLVSALLILLFRQYWRYSRGNIYAVGALCSLAAFVTAGLFNKSIFDMEWLTFFIMAALIGWRTGWSSGAGPQGKILHASAHLEASTPAHGK